MAIGFLTCATCKKVRQNLIPWATAYPPGQLICTFSGDPVTGVPYLLAKTWFTLNSTHSLAYGMIDLPGFNGVTCVGFPDQFCPMPFQ